MSKKRPRPAAVAQPPAEPALKAPVPLRARSPQQNRIFDAYDKSDILFLVGPPDTGKTFSACFKAWHEVVNGTKKRIVVFRPAVDAGEDLGFVPGTYEDKLAGWVEPVIQTFAKIAGKNNRIVRSVVECRSVGLSRGLTFDDAVVIVTESQNCSVSQLKLIMTRLGATSKLVIEGDLGQIDLPRGRSGLQTVIEKIGHLNGVTTMRLVEEPEGTLFTRHKLVREITRLL